MEIAFMPEVSVLVGEVRLVTTQDCEMFDCPFNTTILVVIA